MTMSKRPGKKAKQIEKKNKLQNQKRGHVAPIDYPKKTKQLKDKG